MELLWINTNKIKSFEEESNNPKNWRINVKKKKSLGDNPS